MQKKMGGMPLPLVSVGSAVGELCAAGELCADGTLARLLISLPRYFAIPEPPEACADTLGEWKRCPLPPSDALPSESGGVCMRVGRGMPAW